MMSVMLRELHLTGDPVADKLLNDDPFALLTGMLLDQQYPMKHAFAGPRKIADRMNGFNITKIATTDLDTFIQLCITPPAIHRYGGSMARRIHALALHIIDNYDGRTDGIWTTGRPKPDGPEVLKRLKALPGFGDQKAKIFLALLGKQRGVQPKGWREATELTAEQALQSLEPYCSGFLCTYVDKEGMMQGTDLDWFRRLRAATKREITAAGGITTLDEIRQLLAMNVHAALGMAIYTGRLSLAQLAELV